MFDPIVDIGILVWTYGDPGQWRMYASSSINVSWWRKYASLKWAMPCGLFGDKSLPEPKLIFFLNHKEHISWKFAAKYNNLNSSKAFQTVVCQVGAICVGFDVLTCLCMQGWFYVCAQPMRDVVTK